MRAQRYDMSRSIFHQDNSSTIKMVTNDRSSCGRKLRPHIFDIFFAKGIMERQNIEVKHCPVVIPQLIK